MTTKIFYNNLVFRLVAPTLFGLVIYLMILMFFDSVEMLGTNFFSREVLFVIGLTFVFFELNRMVIIALDRLPGISDSFLPRLSVQFLTSLVLSAGMITICLHLYFVFVEGFSTIVTELITFNAIYLFAALFYHMYYFSILYLYKRNDELLLSEKKSRDSLELELRAYKSQINPEFLFQTLEIIIEELHRDKKHSDDLIDQLARVYRYILDNRHNELVALQDEIGSLEPVLAIFLTKYQEGIVIRKKLADANGFSLVPGTLQIILEHAVINNLITKELPLVLTLETMDSRLLISHNLNERITTAGSNNFRLENLKKAYDYLSPDKFLSHSEGRRQIYTVPLFHVEEE